MAKAIYGYRYEQRDFGTERHLTVFIRATGQEIGTRDPFWSTGILIDPAGRRRRFLKVAREIIREYETSPKAIQPAHPDFWRVYEGGILRANQSTREGAEHYMKPGRVLVGPGERLNP